MRAEVFTVRSRAVPNSAEQSRAVLSSTEQLVIGHVSELSKRFQTVIVKAASFLFTLDFLAKKAHISCRRTKVGFISGGNPRQVAEQHPILPTNQD